MSEELPSAPAVPSIRGLPDRTLSIGELAGRTGVGEGTLRMWEARYGFPRPRRLPSGHRRYAEDDVGRVLAVLGAREVGLPLPLAISRARQLEEQPRPSVYAAVRERFAHLHPHRLPKAALVLISRAIEDEVCARAPRPLLVACFQHERFYRQVQARWCHLAAGAEGAIVLADFPKLARPPGAPAEVPLGPDDPLMREWVLVCDTPEIPSCLVARERAVQAPPRLFEAVWSVEPEVVREAARACLELVAVRAPDLVAELRERLAEPPPPPSASHLRAAVELATRVSLYAVEAS